MARTLTYRQVATLIAMSKKYLQAFAEKKWPRQYPKSFPRLVLAGLLLVLLPLILPLIYSATSINQLSKQSQQAVSQTQQIANYSHLFIDQAIAMEHNVKLTFVLEDRSLLRGYYQGHDKFRAALQGISSLTLDADQKKLVHLMDSAESAIFGKIEKISHSHKKIGKAHVSFAPLRNSTQSFLFHADAPIQHEVENIQMMAGQANKIILWLLAGLVPFAILMALGFSIWIARPIRQIDEAIRSMGNGMLSNTISINGPQDLQQLGERLNWMRQQLLEIENQKTTFLQHISHELKTPLSSLREGTTLLLDGIAGKLTDQQNEIARILFDNSVQLQKRIEDLLNFSELQVGKISLFKKKVAIKTILDSVERDQYLSIMKKLLKIKISCPDIWIECDEQKVRIIFDNLLSNAIKYSSLGGLIKIQGTNLLNAIQIDVIDSGPGIAPADRGRVFEAFYQGGRYAQSHIRGTGLGLSIAREYALAHEGTIELVEFDAGAWFRVILPLNSKIIAATTEHHT
jgi:two-component system sensor histidine kinase GlrK